ncbi:MAG: hypothetical protein K6T75_09455 [Acetobacteraceae bacterium]|nr:hypothetical protein [Acetobacteraceae bacterium]
MSGLTLVLILALLLAGALVTYLCGRITRPALGVEGSGKVAGIVAAAILASALYRFWPLAVAVVRWGQVPEITLGPSSSAFSITLAVDALAIVMGFTILGLALMVAIYSVAYMDRDVGVEKFHALLLLMVAGMLGLVASADLFNMYVFFELMAIASYVLVAFRNQQWEPVEAGIKYVVMSAVGSLLALLGIALLFSYTGELGFAALAKRLSAVPRLPMLVITTLFICGFGVKAAVVPLHTWLPDAHAAAPSGISAMLSGVVIQTGLFAMLRVLMACFLGSLVPFGLALAMFAILTMFVGNLLALVQSDLKRMLAFSSIAQMGYILLGLGLGSYYRYSVSGLSGGLFHIMTHAFMKGLAFLCAGVIIHQLGTRDVEDMRGLGRRMPFTAACFTVAGLALAGVPPFSGFMSKWLIYKAGLDAGTWAGYTCAALAILNSIISLGYYLPVINRFYSKEASPKVAALHEASPWSAVPMGALALATIFLGVYPQVALNAVVPAMHVMLRALGGW